LQRVRATGASFRDADLTGADLTNGDFSGASFRDSNLSGARFGNARVAGADFRDADLRRADFRGTDLGRARNLTQAQLNTACGDSATRVPRGLEVRVCRGGRPVMVIPARPPRPSPPPRDLVANGG
ncbi:MAG: pentapeptide repeat-containing protein, partial [Brevundimonas sp.]